MKTIYLSKSIIILILLNFFSFKAISSNNNSPLLREAINWNSNHKNATYFIENKGQIYQTDGDLASYVSHLYKKGNASIYLLKEGGIAFQFNKVHYPDGYNELIEAHINGDSNDIEAIDKLKKEIRLETYRMDMVLLNANTNIQIVAEDESNDFINYYNRNTLNVRHYKKITYKEVYPGIDWVIYTTKNGGIKYDFEVQAYADISNIQLKFEHYDKLSLLENGDLYHSNIMGTFVEEKPISFQNGKIINTHFVLEDNILSFSLENYDKTLPIVIDPNRVWATYYGGSFTEQGARCNVDINNNVYLTGSTSSTEDIAFGGHQNSYNALEDLFLVKFDKHGNRLWATYYGGDDQEWLSKTTTDKSGNVYLCGATLSTNNIAFNGHQNTLSGGYDALLAKFTPNGNLLWATYYGGNSSEIGVDCVTDNNNNVYLGGETKSTNNIAFLGHQNSYGGGINEGYLAKFDSTGVRQWASYYGGNGDVRARGINTDSENNVYLSGLTENIPNIATNGHQNTYGGGAYDAFLVKFNGNGVRQWATFYGGSLNDNGYNCKTDQDNNVYLVGRTNSTNNIASNGFQNTLGGTFDSFLAKFNSSGQRQWATYYGGGENEASYSCAFDNNGKIYLSGFTFSENNIAFNGHQNTLGGDRDAFLAKFDASGARLWATYYGGEFMEIGTECSVDSDNNVYLSGRTQSSNNIAFNGHQNGFGGNMDAYLVKFGECSNENSITQTNITETACNSFSFNNQIYTSSGIYYDTLINKFNCDSFITLNLTILIDTSVVVLDNSLVSNSFNALYQWIDCNDNDAPVPNATNQVFTPQRAGRYAVEVTGSNNCIDTSSCYEITTVSILEHSLSNYIIYPNPVNNTLFINNLKSSSQVLLSIYNTTGQKILESKTTSNNHTIDVQTLTQGIYMLKIQDGKEQMIFKVIKL